MHWIPLSLPFLLTVFVCSVASQKPRLVRDLLPHYTFSKSTRFSGCRFTGTQPISVQWSYQGNSLPAEPSAGPYFTSDGVLVLENAGPGDSGNYTCTGSNSLGTCTASTTITVRSEESASVGRSWFMMFVYAVLVWLVVSCCVAGWMGYQWWHAEHHKPSPVDRNECFAIDHEGEMVPEPRPGSRMSQEYNVFGGGYPNPAYSGPLQEGATFQQFVDYSSKDGAITKTVTTTQKDYYYIPPNTAEVPVVMRGNRGKGREGKRHSKRSSADAKLQLVEDEVTPDT